MSKNKTLVLLLALSACQPGTLRSERPPDRAPAEALVEAADASAEVPGRAPTEGEDRAIGRLLRVAEEIRDLRFERPVPFRIQSREVITEFVRDKIDADEIERARVFYVALGLLDADLDVRDLLIRVLGEQIVGYYDPDRGLMVVRDDVVRRLAHRSSTASELGDAEMVIVHELVHALQDQRLALGERYEQERTIDAENAFAALVEGDATLAMVGHMSARAGRSLHALTENPALLRTLVRNNPETVTGQEIEQAPPIVRLPLVSRYIDGMLFCALLHGTRGWLGVDDAHGRPPASTEQVLHPERYVAGEAPIDVTLPALPALEAAGFAPFEEETLGELETGIWFALARPGTERDERPAEGWGGDRIRVYRHASGRTAVVWQTVWDDEAEAREAEAAARAVAARSPRPSEQLVARSGRRVSILRDLPAELHAAVQAALAP